MNFLIIADPVEKLKPKSDTGISITREAVRRGHQVHWCTGDDLFLWEGRVFARSSQVEHCQPQCHPILQKEDIIEAVNTYDGAWIRKDPPFDSHYLSLCWLLALEENNVPIYNKPSILSRYHEKMLPFEALEKGFLQANDIIPTFLTTGKRFNVPQNFPRGEAITKPWLGFGGKEVQKLDAPHTPPAYTMLQPYIPSITTRGDRRVFFLDGEYVGDFVRLPAPGKITANLAQGGSAIMRERSSREVDLCHKVGNFLKEIGVALAGADFIDDKLSEINITAPTGFETLVELGGPKLSAKFLDFVEAAV